MLNNRPKYDCFYGISGSLPADDKRLTTFQAQMINNGWDNSELWSFDYVLFQFSKDSLQWIWKQHPEIKPDDKRLFKSIKLNDNESLLPPEQYELGHYFWIWLKNHVLKETSTVSQYELFRIAFFEFLAPRLDQFTKNSKSTLVKDVTYTDYFKMLDNTLNFVIPISLSGESESHQINNKRYLRMLNEFMKSIPGLWL
jgi:hypothetical protein